MTVTTQRIAPPFGQPTGLRVEIEGNVCRLLHWGHPRMFFAKLPGDEVLVFGPRSHVSVEAVDALRAASKPKPKPTAAPAPSRGG